MEKKSRVKSEATKIKDRERTRNWEKVNPNYNSEWQKRNVASRLCSIAKQRSKKRNVEFSITKEDITVPEFCPILGIKLEMNNGTGAGGKDNSYSLDRIDQSKGYIKGNVQVISHKANSMKFTASSEDLVKFAEWIMRTYK
jgi:hypothetical protein